MKKVCLEIVPGDFTVILGASGSGKSTLLHILSGLERPDSGTVTYGGLDITKRTDPELTRFRRETVGFVFQQYYLLPHMTVAKNVRMGADLAGHRTYADIIRACLLYTSYGGACGTNAVCDIIISGPHCQSNEALCQV